MVAYQASSTSYVQAFLAARAARREQRINQRVVIRNGSIDYTNALRIVLHLAGFVCLSVAGFKINDIAGMSLIGVSCFAFSWLAAPTSDTHPNVRQ